MSDTMGIKNFGQRDDDDESGSDLMAMFQDAEETDELLPAEDGQEAPTEPEVDNEPDEPVAGAPEPALDEQQQAEQDRLYANKYRSPEDLERAYIEVTSGFTRQAQENAMLRAQQEQFQAAMQQQQEQMSQQMGQVYEYLQAQFAENDPEGYEQLQRQLQMQQQLDQQVEQRLTPMQQQLEAQQQQVAQQQKVAQLQSAAQDFYARHQDLQQGSAEDQRMAAVITEMWQNNVPLDIGNPEHLEFALEASQNPALAQEAMMAPQAIQVPGGVARLRERVGATIQVANGAPRDNGTPPKAPVRQRVEAFVETGAGGAPQSGAPGRVPDEFDEAWSSFRERSDKGALFGGRTG